MVDHDRENLILRANEISCFGSEFYQAVIVRTEQSWIGADLLDDVGLDQLAIAGTTELWVHGYRYVRKTAATIATDIYEYEEILDSSGRVSAIRPREIIPLGAKCLMYYIPAVIF